MTEAQWQFGIVDVFADRPLTGNQLAVFEDAAPIPDRLLQPLAREIGFAETVFVYPPVAGGDARMRIFTPAQELPFAGHPVLGTAVALAERRGQEQIVLETGRGLVPVDVRMATNAASRGEMQQPPPTVTPYPDAEQFLQALGLSRSGLPVLVYDNGVPHVFAMADSREDVAGLSPDLAALSRLAHESSVPVVGFNVFSGADRNWKTRMFAPGAGIPEDPATGSAAGSLALHLATHGRIPWGEEITIAQGEEFGRPSSLFARVSGRADQIDRIEVGGHAVVVGGGWFDARLLGSAAATAGG